MLLGDSNKTSASLVNQELLMVRAAQGYSNRGIARRRIGGGGLQKHWHDWHYCTWKHGSGFKSFSGYSCCIWLIETHPHPLPDSCSYITGLLHLFSDHCITLQS